MNLGIKLLIGGVSLASASGGGYVVYKKVTSSNEEDKVASKPEVSNGEPQTESETVQEGQTGPKTQGSPGAGSPGAAA